MKYKLELTITENQFKTLLGRAEEFLYAWENRDIDVKVDLPIDLNHDEYIVNTYLNYLMQTIWEDKEDNKNER